MGSLPRMGVSCAVGKIEVRVHAQGLRLPGFLLTFRRG